MNRGGIKSKVVESGAVALGGNEFETSSIMVAPNGIIKKGTVLKRDGDRFASITDINSETPVAVNPFDIQNNGSSAADMSFRAIISGPVRASFLEINGVKTTAAENDKIRGYATIIPIKETDISHIK